MTDDQTVGRWLSDSARAFAHRVAIDDRGVTTTYAELDRRVDRLVRRLARAGYRPGDRIATITGNSADHVVLFFACARLGIGMSPLSWRAAPRELAYELGVVDPQLVVVEEEYGVLADAAVALLDRTPTQIRFDGLDHDMPGRDHPSSPADERPPRNDDPLLIMFTSGSTGAPKAAILTHSTCFWTNLAFSRAVPVSRDDVVLSLLPQHHVGSWNVQTLLAWWVGAKVVIERGFDPRRVLELIRTRSITMMMGVPTHYRALADYRGFADADISSLCTAVVGGAPATGAMLQTWHDRGVRLTQGYGLTEAGPNVLCLLPEEAAAHVGTAGRPYHHLDVRLVDHDTGEVLDGPARGELQVKGPGLFVGYHGDEAATREAFTADGWLRTGDLVERDADGYHTIIDRMDGLYISGGINVAPAEVEKALLEHPGVERVVVVGVPDEKWGQVGLARVVRREGSSVDAAELLRHCRSRLARYKVPAQIVFVPDLPEGSLEKVRRRAVLEESAT